MYKRIEYSDNQLLRMFDRILNVNLRPPPIVSVSDLYAGRSLGNH